MKTISHRIKNSNNTTEDGKISHAHGMAKSTL
jgi:hypothetical protein